MKITMKKNILCALTVALALTLCFVACKDKDDTAVTGVALNETKLTLTEGNTFQLLATVQPGNAANKDVTWQSTNTAVATVDAGLVTAVSIGQATIIVVTEDGQKTATCAVSVVPVTVTSVVLDQKTAELGGNQTLPLTATVLPERATNKNVTWRSSNPSVATVNNNGIVTSTSTGGTAMIIVTTDEGGKSDTCHLTVTISVESVSLDLNTATVGLGDELTLRATVLPLSAANRAVTWESTNPSIVTVDNGVVHGVALGTASVVVKTTEGGKTDTCYVTVVQPVPNCNSSTPGWGANLGTVSFISNNTWSFGGLKWSDDVIASACDKTTYNVNQSSNFNADCRSNGTHGHLFSWCAIARFKDGICPVGWRIPTAAEFLSLDIAIGETGSTKFDKYISDWGATLGGWVNFAGSMMQQGTSAYYWSQTSPNVQNGTALSITSPSSVNAQLSTPRQTGATLRCVQNL
jgi:uncharacterized protein (TIGR02145 family)